MPHGRARERNRPNARHGRQPSAERAQAVRCASSRRALGALCPPRDHRSSTHHPRRDATSTRRPRIPPRNRHPPQPSCGPLPRDRPLADPPPPHRLVVARNAQALTSSLTQGRPHNSAELARTSSRLCSRTASNPPPDDPTAPSRAATSSPRSSWSTSSGRAWIIPGRVFRGSRKRTPWPPCLRGPTRVSPAKDPSSRRFRWIRRRGRDDGGRERRRERGGRAAGSRGLWDGRARGADRTRRLGVEASRPSPARSDRPRPSPPRRRPM